MPTTIRTRDPRELLSLVPYQLGFRPRDSVVLLGLRGPRSRVGLVVRVDLADLASPDDGPQVADLLVGHLRDDGCTGCLVAVYAPGDVRHPEDLGVARARRHLAEAAGAGLDLVATWGVGDEGYYDVDCADPRCCPPGGRPLADLDATEVSAQMVLHGVAVAPSRDAVGRIDPAPADARRSARKAARRWATRRHDVATEGELHRWRATGLDQWRTEHRRLVGELSAAGEDARLTRGAPPVVLGRIQAALDDVVVRDAVLLDLVRGSDRLADRLLAGDDDPAVLGAFGAALFDRAHGVPPDEVWTRAAGALLEQVVAHSTRAGHAPALTLLGTIAWWAGDGARAALHLGRALAVDPEYRLAVLVGDAVDRGVAPGWVAAGRP